MPQNLGPNDTDPQPTDPPFLFCILLAVRKARDAMLESLARDWLDQVGIHVVFADELDSPPSNKAVRP